MEEPRLVPVGKIARTHGVRGAVKIYPYGDTLALQEPGALLMLKTAVANRPQTLTLVNIRQQGRFLIGQFQELSGMEAARLVLGQEVFLPEDRLPPTEEGEYYYYQLIGLNVETTDGKPVGRLTGILETGANDVYIIDRNGREVLIPAVEEIVARVDLQRRLMVIDPPEGLIDDL